MRKPGPFQTESDNGTEGGAAADHTASDLCHPNMHEDTAQYFSFLPNSQKSHAYFNRAHLESAAPNTKDAYSFISGSVLFSPLIKRCIPPRESKSLALSTYRR